MKKIICMLLTLAIMLSVCGCSYDKKNEDLIDSIYSTNNLEGLWLGTDTEGNQFNIVFYGGEMGYLYCRTNFFHVMAEDPEPSQAFWCRISESDPERMGTSDFGGLTLHHYDEGCAESAVYFFDPAPKPESFALDYNHFTMYVNHLDYDGIVSFERVQRWKDGEQRGDDGSYLWVDNRGIFEEIEEKLITAADSYVRSNNLGYFDALSLEIMIENPDGNMVNYFDVDSYDPLDYMKDGMMNGFIRFNAGDLSYGSKTYVANFTMDPTQFPYQVNIEEFTRY